MARYDSFGPFRLARVGNKVMRAQLSSFWNSRLNDSEAGLCTAVGIYIITVQSTSDGPYKPWYVGRTDKQGFQQRFVNHELLFRKILDKAKSGQIHVFLIAMRSPSGKAFRKVSTTNIEHNDWLESTLIGSALSKNPDLLNVSKTKKLKTLVLPGILNTPQGALSSAATSVKRMLHSH